MMTPTFDIRCTDVMDERKGLPSLSSKSIDLIITSPPYWDLKDYGGGEREIGFGQDYEDYLGSLWMVFDQCHRLLAPGCWMGINVGDVPVRGREDVPHHTVPLHSSITEICCGIGLQYQGMHLWCKIPNSRSSGGGPLMGSLYKPRDGCVASQSEFILMFRKKGESKKPSDERIKIASNISKEARIEWSRQMWNNIKPASQKSGHPAMFPLEIPYRLIRLRSWFGETVLDPFMGFGTTAVAARILGRNCVGFDLNPTSCSETKKRISHFDMERDALLRNEFYSRDFFSAFPD